MLPRIRKRSVDFIDRQADEQRPFFLYVALSSPHVPWLPQPPYKGRSEAGPYGDFTTQSDAVLGAVLDKLEQSGQAENTLVIFTSDNGARWGEEDREKWDHRANGPWRGMKSDIWEGGHHVPFVAYWPGHIEGGASRTNRSCSPT